MHPFLFLLLSSAHGITYNCINKDNPSSACCSGEITLHPTMTTIGNNAFLGCSGLTGSLTIPSSVISIGNRAFDGCSGLTGPLIIPSSATSIGSHAFYHCSGLTSLTIPSSVTSIGGYAFEGCSGLTGSLTIPSSVTSIGNFAFNGCSRLTGSLTIPTSISSIGSSTFWGCSGFTGSLTIPSFVTSIGEWAFAGCSGLTGSLTIPSSVTSIGVGAFSGCSGITRGVTFPNSVSLLFNVFQNNKCNWISCCDSCILIGAAMCVCDSSPCHGVCSSTFFPTFQPTFESSSDPNNLLSSLSSTLFCFHVRIGDEAILVDYLQDLKRERMTPISRIVDTSQVSSDSDPQPPSNFIILKWRPMTAGGVTGGMGSWDTNSAGNRTINISGGVIVYWLVSLSSDEMMGFIVQDPNTSFSTYVIYFIQYPSSSRRLSLPSSSWSNNNGSHRSLTISDLGISISISPNQTLSSRTIRMYVTGISDQRFYLLSSGWRR